LKVIDANVLVYAINTRAPHHEVAHRWLDDVLGGTETVGIPVLVAVAFLRLTTNSVILDRPLTADQALDVVEGWLGRPNVVLIEPTARHLDVLRGLLAVPGAAGNLVNDAHIAALAVEHGAQVASFDRDFGRFPGVQVVVPGS
jgi:toxin-antitoxin system PIN domain toxin